MMERRYIVTAQIRKEWSTTRARGQGRTKHVAVLLGDPDKPDPLKPSCVFDDDDIYTIDRMKAASANCRVTGLPTSASTRR